MVLGPEPHKLGSGVKQASADSLLSYLPSGNSSDGKNCTTDGKECCSCVCAANTRVKDATTQPKSLAERKAAVLLDQQVQDAIMNAVFLEK